MEILWIISVICIVIGILWIIIALLTKTANLEFKLENTKSELKHKDLALENATSQFLENANKPISIGKIEKYTEKDIDFFWKNLEFVETVMKYLEYEIAVKTDTMRNMNDGMSPAEKAGYLNALHSNYLFFYKILNKTTKEDKYSWQELV